MKDKDKINYNSPFVQMLQKEGINVEEFEKILRVFLSYRDR